MEPCLVGRVEGAVGRPGLSGLAWSSPASSWAACMEVGAEIPREL